MKEKSTNEIVAANIKYWMGRRQIPTQAALAAKVGVVQRTIGNYLKPSLRKDTSKGREASAKLTELSKIAKALDVQVWHLLRPLSADEWQAYEAVEAAFLALNPPKEPKKEPEPLTLQQLKEATEQPKTRRAARTLPTTTRRSSDTNGNH